MHGYRYQARHSGVDMHVLRHPVIKMLQVLMILQAIVPTGVTTGSMQYPVQLPLPLLAVKVICNACVWQCVQMLMSDCAQPPAPSV